MLNLLTIKYDNPKTKAIIMYELNIVGFPFSIEIELYKLIIVRNKPAIVIGTPWNTLLNVVILYLASLYAPAIGNIKVIKYPKMPKCTKLMFQAITIGATPKDIKSAKESSSFPRSLTTSKCLAAFPSNLSVNAASITSKDALIKRLIELLLKLSQDNNIAITPKERLIKVKIFGIAFL